MADDFRPLTSRSHIYWQTVADHMATKGREIGRAKAANWAGGKNGDVVRHHFQKHSTVLGIADYNQGAIDIIRRAGRDTCLSIRDGSLVASFARPHRRISSKGKNVEGFIVTVVDLEDSKLLSHHFKEKLPAWNDEVPPVKQGGRGIAKWLIG